MRICKICGAIFIPRKEQVYTVCLNSGFAAALSGFEKSDVMDCPRCGCQNILCKRYDRAFSGETEATDDE